MFHAAILPLEAGLDWVNVRHNPHRQHEPSSSLHASGSAHDTHLTWIEPTCPPVEEARAEGNEATPTTPPKSAQTTKTSSSSSERSFPLLADRSSSRRPCRAHQESLAFTPPRHGTSPLSCLPSTSANPVETCARPSLSPHVCLMFVSFLKCFEIIVLLSISFTSSFLPSQIAYTTLFSTIPHHNLAPPLNHTHFSSVKLRANFIFRMSLTLPLQPIF